MRRLCTWSLATRETKPSFRFSRWLHGSGTIPEVHLPDSACMWRQVSLTVWIEKPTCRGQTCTGQVFILSKFCYICIYLMCCSTSTKSPREELNLGLDSVFFSKYTTPCGSCVSATCSTFLSVAYRAPCSHEITVAEESYALLQVHTRLY